MKHLLLLLAIALGLYGAWQLAGTSARQRTQRLLHTHARRIAAIVALLLALLALLALAYYLPALPIL